MFSVSFATTYSAGQSAATKNGERNRDCAGVIATLIRKTGLHLSSLLERIGKRSLVIAFAALAVGLASLGVSIILSV